MPRLMAFSGDGRLARLVSHVRTPLYGGAYALILSSSTTSGLGILYWALAARLYDAEQVGANAAGISAMILISYLGQLNLAGVLSRFLPTAGSSTRRLMVLSYVAGGTVSALGAVIFVVWFAGLAGLGPLLAANPWAGAWFVVATVAWSLFTLEDGALTGLRQTLWVPIENSVYGVGKIVLLLAFVAGLANFGIFASWTIPAAVLLVPVNWLIFRRLVPRHMAAGQPGPPGALPAGSLRYLGGDFIGSLFNAASTGVLPLMVVLEVGARGGAYFYIAWTIASSLYLISVNMAISLMVEGAARRATVAEDTLRMFRVMLRLQLLVVVIAFTDAPLILSIFHPVYASEAATLLRLLALAVLPHGVNVLYLATARVRRQVGRIILVQATLATVSLGASAALLGPLGIAGAGIAWLGTQSAVAAILLTTQLLPLWRGSQPGAAEILPKEAAPTASATHPLPLPPLLLASFSALDAAGVRWCLLRGDPDDLARGARDVDLLVAADDWPRLDRLFAGLRLLRISSQGGGRGGFYVGRDAGSGAWVRIDIITDLAYGRFGQFETGTAATCLARLTRRDEIPVMDPDDAFWALVLHCMLEKGAVADRHATRLQALVDQARDDGPLGTFVAAVLPADRDPARLRAMVRDDAWPDLVALRNGVLLRLWRRDMLGTTRRAVGRAVRRCPGFGWLRRGRWGVSVALLGPDGAGKTTLAAAIAAEFGLPVRQVYMGMWSQSQRGVLGGVPVLALVARPIAALRKGLVGEYHRAHGRLVIYDRYTYDALLAPRGRLELVKRSYLWILEHAAPTPQLVIVLDAPGDLLFARKGESDPARLEQDRRAFCALADRLAGLRVVDAARSPDAVRAEVTGLIWQRFLDGSKDG